MPATEGTAQGTSGSGVSSLSWSHTCVGGAANVLTVGVTSASVSPTPTVSAITFDSVSMGAAKWSALFDDTTHALRSNGFTLQSPNAGTKTVAVTFSTNVGDAVGISVSFTGADTATPVGTGNGNTGTGATITVDVTAATGDLVVDGSIVFQPTITVNGSQTEQKKIENVNFESAGGASTKAGATTVTMSWTYGTGGVANKWATGGIAIKGASAAAIVARRTSRPFPFKPGSARPR